MRSTKAVSTLHTRIILAVLIAAAAGAVMIGVRRGPRASVEQTRLRPWSALRSGESAEYRIDYSATGRSEVNALFASAETDPLAAPAASTIETEVAGTASFAAVAQGADSTIVALTIGAPVIRLVIDDVASPELSRETAELICGPTFIELDARGRVRQIWIPSQPESVSSSLTRSLLALIQFVLPENGSRSETWSTDEDGGDGKCRASYALDPSSRSRTDSILLSKQMSCARTADAASQPGGPNVASRIQSSTNVAAEFDRSTGAMRTLRADGQSHVYVSDREIAASKATLTMQLGRSGPLSDSEFRRLAEVFALQEAKGEPISLSWTPSADEIERKIQEQELGAITLADLLAQLDEAERSTNPEQQVAELYLKFKALCFLDPASAHDLGALLIQATVEAPRAGLFASVLGTVGHSDAQRALIAAINARADDWEALALLIPTLGDAARPDPEAVAALEHLIGETQDERIRSTAQLALGNMARSIVRSSPERASRIVRFVLDELGRTSDEPTKRTLLLVLGNCGAVEALPEIRPYLASDSVDLRSAAFAALRFVDGSPVDVLLIGALTEDPAEAVKLEALDAFAVRAPNQAALEAIAGAARSDSAVNVRIKAVEVLWDVHPSRPAAAQILKSILEQDQSTDVKRAVRARLESAAGTASAAMSRPA